MDRAPAVSRPSATEFLVETLRVSRKPALPRFVHRCARRRVIGNLPNPRRSRQRDCLALATPIVAHRETRVALLAGRSSRPARCRRHAAPEALPPNARPLPAGRPGIGRTRSSTTASGWSPADPRSGQSCNHVVEHPQLVADRIGRYARIVGRENVIPGTDCGLRGRIHPQIAWAKLEVTRAGAALASRLLWPV